MKNFPFTPFPNGWFRVAYSNELPNKKVIPIHYFGKDLVIFRTENGRAHVLDAHCPHLGAHLGHGGVVEGQLIRCPFHSWAFNPQGSCVDIPYTNKIPSKVRIRSWPVCELHGLIMVYYHSQGATPDWKMPAEFPWWNSQEWTNFTKPDKWKIRNHVQEIDENNMDIAHMLPVHNTLVTDLKDYPLEIDGPILIHRMFAKVEQKIFFKMSIKASFEVEFKFYGLGCHCTYTRTADNKESLTLALLTPVDEEYVEIHTIASVKKMRFNSLGTWAIRRYTHNLYNAALKQDLPIWENKIHRAQPLLCEGDGQIMPYRRWAAQFYDSDVPNTIPESLKV